MAHLNAVVSRVLWVVTILISQDLSDLATIQLKNGLEFLKLDILPVDVPSINVRNKTKQNSGKSYQHLLQGERIYYDSYVIKEGFVWISYVSYSDERHYVATGTHNGSERTSTWGSFS